MKENIVIEDSANGDYKERARIAEAKLAVMKQALQEIADIDLLEYGGDYDEIEQAQDIANTALAIDKTTTSMA